MIHLGVNIDHIATLREARKTYEPDPVNAIFLAEQGGADGITVHLREDRRHIQDRDVFLIREVVSGKLNLEMALNDDVIAVALQVKPDQVTIVPEKREEITTEGGLDCLANETSLQKIIPKFLEQNIEVSLFIDPDLRQVETAKDLGAIRVEFHTGSYANAYYAARGSQRTKKNLWVKEKERLYLAAHKASKIGLEVAAGHGLNYHNIHEILEMPDLNELNIGHAIIARSVFTGLTEAVREMKKLLQQVP